MSKYVPSETGFKDSRNKKSEEERSPKGVEEGEKGLSPSQKPLREQRKTGGPLPLTLESVMTTPTASTNRSTNVCYLAQKPRKSMSAPVFRTSHDPLVLLALPTFCSYQPQTPRRHRCYHQPFNAHTRNVVPAAPATDHHQEAPLSPVSRPQSDRWDNSPGCFPERLVPPGSRFLWRTLVDSIDSSFPDALLRDAPPITPSPQRSAGKERRRVW
jgi:hypothetical protein